MKKTILSLFTVLLLFAVSMTSYAGQWMQDNQGYRYQNDDGTYKTGWYQDVDEKWYYFDNQSNYMLSNTITPDGYTVLSDGKWDERSATNLLIDKSRYAHKLEMTINRYTDGPDKVRDLGYDLPVTIYYNDKYDLGYGDSVAINGFEMSKDGIPYVKYTLSSQLPFTDLDVLTVSQMPGGTTVEERDSIVMVWDNQSSDVIMSLSALTDPKPVSMEIYIGK